MLQQLLIISKPEAANDDPFDAPVPPRPIQRWRDYEDERELLLAQQHQMAMQAQEDCQ